MAAPRQPYNPAGAGISGGLAMPQSRFFRPRSMPRPINQGSQIQQAGQSIGTAIEGFGDLFKKIKQDKIANDLMNEPSQAYANQAVSDMRAQQGTLGDEDLVQQTLAGPQHTGGLDEMALRLQWQKAKADDLDQQIKQAQLQDLQNKAASTGRYAPKPGYNPAAGAGSTSRWIQQTGQPGGKPQKPAPYVAGSVDPNDPEADDMNKVRADYDLIHGKGSFNKAQTNMGKWTVQNGQYVLPDKDGNPVDQMSVDEGNKWILRINAARIAQGVPQLPVPVPVQGSNPRSTDPPGSITNPYKPTSALESRGIPNNSYVIDPTTGQTVLKKADPNYRKPQDQTATQPAESQPAESDTSSTDNQGLGDEELENEATTSAGQDSSVDDAIAQAKARQDLYT